MWRATFRLPTASVIRCSQSSQNEVILVLGEHVPPSVFHRSDVAVRGVVGDGVFREHGRECHTSFVVRLIVWLLMPPVAAVWGSTSPAPLGAVRAVIARRSRRLGPAVDAGAGLRRRHVRIVRADGTSVPFNKIRPSYNAATPM